MKKGHIHPLIYLTFSAASTRSLRLSLIAGVLVFLLAGCQPITAIEQPIALEATPTQEATATETPTEEAVLLIPTDTPTATTEVPATETPTEVQPSPTEELVLLIPTDTPAPTHTPVLTVTTVLAPQITALNSINVRSGPGTDYPVSNGLAAGTQAPVSGKNADASWWQITLADGTSGWVYATLVEFAGDSATIPVVAVPPPPPTPTPAPLPTVRESSTQTQETQTIADTPPTAVPAQPPPVSDGATFRVIQKRLWDVYENGGSLSGDSVNCGEKRQLVVVVVDKNGVRLNGVAVQAQYGSREIFVTGSQGKGDGAVEFILGSGQDVTVIRDVDGSSAISEVATNLVTRPDVIPYADLIAGRYCTDDASCTHFVNAPGCLGHYSWTVVFERNY